MSAGTKHSAPTTHPAPTVARSITTAFIPTRTLRPTPRAVHDGAVADVRALLEHDGDAGEHVHGAVLLHVAAVLDDDAAPVAADRRAGPDVHVAADGDVARHRGLRVHERVSCTTGMKSSNA